MWPRLSTLVERSLIREIISDTNRVASLLRGELCRPSSVEINRELGGVGKFEGRLPQLRTIQRIVADMYPKDTSGRWEPGEN